MNSENPKKLGIKRRDFMKKSLLASSVFIVPRNVLGGIGHVAPSDQLNLAAIGVGGKGSSDIYHAWNNGSERVVALCDVHSDGKHGVTTSRERFPNAKFYKDFRVMFDNQTDIDAVTITTPDHTHANAAIWAMERNKHVYVQKPLTHNIKEARKLTLMAREKQIVSQMGNQGGSNPDQLVIQKWVKDGEIGDISTVYVWTNRPVWPQGFGKEEEDPSQKPENLEWDLWLGPAKSVAYTPKLHPFNWRGWWEYGTGALGDMGCHIIDVPYKALELKYPIDVQCSVGTVYTKMWSAEYHPEGCPASSMVTLTFEPTSLNNSKIKMIWMDGGIRPAHPEKLPVEVEIGPNGILMVGDKGVIMSDVYGIDPKLYKSGEPVQVGEKTDNPLYEIPEYGHQKSWVAACKAGFDSPEHRALTSSFDYAGPMTETVLMGNIAIRSYNLQKEISGGQFEYYGRKKLLWDGENMRITNFEEANQFVGRDYRYSWAIK